MQRGADWTDQEIETLKTLWSEEGYSAGQIARALGGRTRSAVIGKIHRLNLPERPCDAVRGHRVSVSMPRAATRDRLVRTAPRQQQRQLRRQPEPEAARLENGALIGTADLTDRHCRWPHGDVGTAGFHYCGQQPKAGSSWCPHHAARATAISNAPVSAADVAGGRRAESQFAKIWG